jgi:uncharacterized glyoxalase superfamily protein PhnB
MGKYTKVFLSLPILIGFALFITVLYSQGMRTVKEKGNVYFKTLTPNLVVKDMDKTIRFYRDVLGFEVLMTAPEKEPFDWAMMKMGNVEIMFQTRQSLGGEMAAFKEIPVGGSFTLYIDVANVEGLYETVKGKATVEKALHDTFYGTREFVIRDCNGYVMVFAEAAGKE